MTACQCPQCSSTPAPTYTPEFREACRQRHVARLAAAVLDLPTLDERRAYLADYPGDRKRLEAAIMKLHEERKNAA